MHKIRFSTAGESHGKELIGILEGIPAGIKLRLEVIASELTRRREGFGRGKRMLLETDAVEVISGVRFGETLGSPIALKIKNEDHKNWLAKMSVWGKEVDEQIVVPRPGHADFAGSIKYDRKDIRDVLERASARETAMRVAMGAIAKEFLHILGIDITARVISIGQIVLDEFKEQYPFMKEYASKEIEKKFMQVITCAKNKGDTLGGIFEVRIKNLPIGLGSYVAWDQKIDALLSMAMMSIQGIKGVEIGEGFFLANMLGSCAHDELYLSEDKKIYRNTNHAGGIEGGMTNGEDVILKCAMKPIPTLMKPLHSVDLVRNEETLATTERSDVCAVFSAAVVGEAMAALVIADAVLLKFGGDSIKDVLYAYKRAKFK